MKQQDQNNSRVRIINKTKEGCILDFKGSVGQKYITWEEFKKIYTIKDHIWAEMNEEYTKKLDEVKEKIGQLAALTLIVNNEKNNNLSPEKKLTYLAMIGDLSTELTKDLNCTLPELMALVKKQLSGFKVPEGKIRKPEKRNKTGIIATSSNPKTTTIGSLFESKLGDLKKKMEDNEKKK